jgi:hypothetical protein
MAEATNRRNVGILILPGTKQTLFMEGGLEGVVGWKDSTAMSTGLVQGYLKITAQEAVAHALRFSTARLTLWKN